VAWTTRTWVAGSTVLAAWMNELRDNFKAIGDAWTTSYTPVLTGTTNPAIGNGTAVGHYISAGKLTIFSVKITFGSTSTYGSGAWFVSLPVARASGGVIRADCFYESAGAARYRGTSYAGTTTTIGLGVDAGSAGGALSAVDPAVPFTWASGAFLEVSGTYEAA